MKSYEKRKAPEWAYVGALILASLLAAWHLLGGKYLDLHIPLTYEGDGILILSLIQRAVRNHWLFSTRLLGAPFGASLYDYPIPDSGSILTLKIFGHIFKSPAIALNLYYLIGFPLDAIAAYFVLRRFQIFQILSLAGSLIFAFLPFHFLRLNHLFYTWYFAAPIFIWYAKQLWDGDLLFGLFRSPAKKTIINVLILLGLSCFGVYYAFFGVLCLLTAGIARCAQQRSIVAIRPAVIAVAIVSLGIVANVSPSLIYRMQHGVNQETAQRSPVEAEIYGLKIDQLLLPRPQHRFPAFAELTERYSKTFPLVNENSFASLGMIGSAGFLGLVIFLAAPTRRGLPDGHLQFLASLTIALVLFCTIGGFSGLFSLLISPMIRAWNRVSVFIAFTSITVVLLFFQRQLLTNERAFLRAWVLSVLLCTLALWDQTTPPCLACLAKNKADFDSDAQFAREMEQTVPAGSAIYQLPYVGFPEVPPVNHLPSYDLARPFLHANTLRWSFGGIKGREGDLFFRYLALEPLTRQVEVIKRAGFRGIYIDRRGYADNGAAVESELAKILGVVPIVSPTGEQAFFASRDLASQGNVDFSRMTARQIMEYVGYVVDKFGPRSNRTLSEGIDFAQPNFPVFLEDVRGLSAREDWGRWSDANLFPVVVFKFNQPLPRRFILHIRLMGYGPNVGKPSVVQVGQQAQTITPDAQIRDFALPFDNIGASSTIRIQPPLPSSPQQLGMSSDTRQLGIGIQRLWITTAEK